MEIRKMTAEDIPDVSEVLCSCYRWLGKHNTYTDQQVEFLVSQRGSMETVKVESQSQMYLVASKNGRIMAVAAIKDNELAKLFVDPAYHGQGIGSMLFRSAEHTILAAGFEEMIAGVMARSAIGFYEKMGMSIFGEKIPETGAFAGHKTPLMKKVLPLKFPENITLIDPTVKLKSEFGEMVEEYLAAGDDKQDWRFEQALPDFGKYVQKFLDYAQGKNLPEGWVPETTLWLVKDRTCILGRTSIRHYLTPVLEQRGGHIGYYIRPSQRRKGYGTLILALSLEKAKQLAFKKVLVTCNEDNVASIKIIEKNGGILAGKVQIEGLKVPTRQYWIDLID